LTLLLRLFDALQQLLRRLGKRSERRGRLDGRCVGCGRIGWSRGRLCRRLLCELLVCFLLFVLRMRLIATCCPLTVEEAEQCGRLLCDGGRRGRSSSSSGGGCGGGGGGGTHTRTAIDHRQADGSSTRRLR
jgi:hypothetical protein